MVKRELAVQRLEMVYRDVTKIRTFTRIDKAGNIKVRRECVLPVPANFIILKIGPL